MTFDLLVNLSVPRKSQMISDLRSLSVPKKSQMISSLRSLSVPRKSQMMSYLPVSPSPPYLLPPPPVMVLLKGLWFDLYHSGRGGRGEGAGRGSREAESVLLWSAHRGVPTMILE